MLEKGHLPFGLCKIPEKAFSSSNSHACCIAVDLCMHLQDNEKDLYCSGEFLFVISMVDGML